MQCLHKPNIECKNYKQQTKQPPWSIALYLYFSIELIKIFFSAIFFSLKFCYLGWIPLLLQVKLLTSSLEEEQQRTAEAQRDVQKLKGQLKIGLDSLQAEKKNVDDLQAQIAQLKVSAQYWHVYQYNLDSVRGNDGFVCDERFH